MSRFKFLLAIMPLATICVLGAPIAPAEEVPDGAARDEVEDILGRPAGEVVHGDTVILYYPRGQVDLENDKVVGNTILSESEFEKRERAQEAAAKEQAELAAQRRAQEAQAAREAAASEPDEEEAKRLAAEEAKKQAEIEEKIAEGMKKPSGTVSSRRFRKYRRGRSQAALDKREAELRAMYEQEE